MKRKRTFLSNHQIAEMLQKLADLYEAEGKDHFRVRAYRRASRSIEKLPYEISNKIHTEKDLTEIPMIGSGIAWQIKNILKTGKLSIKSAKKAEKPFYNDLLTIPGLGPKRIKQLRQQLKISNVKQLKQAIADGLLARIPHFGQSLIESIQKGIESPREYEKFFHFFQAKAVIGFFIDQLKKFPEIEKCEAAGEYRRKKEIVGNVDIIVTLKKLGAINNKIIALPIVREIIQNKTNLLSMILSSGIRVNIHITEPENFGGYLLSYTGNHEHLQNLYKIAHSKKYLLDQDGLYKNKKLLAGQSEQEIYNKLDLAFIEPELRENRGEIIAAQNNSLPNLIQVTDIKGDLHCHTNETDGTEDLKTMVEAAIQKGYEYLAITDHSKRLVITNGLDEKRLRKQIEQIDQLNSNLKNFTVLKSIEVDILPDGSLDLSNDVLKELDLCVCSIHSLFRLSKEKQTERIIRAMDNPYFTILGHPTGRLIQRRKPYEIDLEKILIAAKERGCFMELNAQPYRLDLKDDFCKMAKETGVMIAISTDAHSIRNLNYLTFGINQARRGWLEPRDVINTRNIKDLRLLLKRK